MSLRLVLAAEGNANTRDCWSGSAQGFVNALRRKGHTIEVINAEITDWTRYPIGLLGFHTQRARWRQRYILGLPAFLRKSAIANRALRSMRPGIDAVIQVGATFQLSRQLLGSVPLAVYADANIRFAARGRPFARPSLLSGKQLDRIARREGQVYQHADRIWTMSSVLAESFVQDFHIPRGRIRTIYAGANAEVKDLRGRREKGAPTLLFMGKDHVRKGSGILLEAFREVRKQIPNAELHIVGSVPPGSDHPGVIAHGFLSWENPQDSTRLMEVLAKSTAFCLPSRYEPFGVVFVEAMLAGLPCIGTRHWAMPEIIAEHETGWLVEDGSVDDLVRAILDALRNPDRSAAMGEAGRERALRLFTWDRVAERALQDLDELLGLPD